MPDLFNGLCNKCVCVCVLVRSPVYVWRDGGFRLDHHIDTLEATDVESVDISGAVWLAVATGE